MIALRRIVGNVLLCWIVISAPLLADASTGAINGFLYGAGVQGNQRISVRDLDKNLSSYVGLYISRGEKDTEYLDVALISHHLLFAYRSKSFLHRECWVAKSGHDELFAVNGVASQYKKARTFAVDQYGLLRLEPGGIQDIERSDGYPDYTIHWRRVSKAPNMAEIRLCER